MKQPPTDFYLGGIQVNEADHQAWFDALKQQGMNTVQVTDYARQGDWDSDHMWWDEDPKWALEEIRGAKANGLNVVMICRVALDHEFERNAFLWHGMIMPKTDELLASWFEQYTRFTVRWAEFAEREGVDVLMIGSELNALASTLPLEEIPTLEEYYLNEEKQAYRKAEVLAHREAIEGRELWLDEREKFDTIEGYLDARIATEQGWAKQLAAGGSVEQINGQRALLQELWTRLIAEVRKVYSGKLGYAANFDQYHLVGFWPQLDIMGINAYFKLREQLVEGEDWAEQIYPLLTGSWQQMLGEIRDFRHAQGVQDMPVVFTEMGYTRRANSTLEPWADTGFSLIKTPITNPDGSTSFTEQMIIWREQPERYLERALAVRALHEAHSNLEEPFLRGILYWKLSTHEDHKDIESFMVHIGDSSEDPILPELRKFLEAPPQHD